MQRGTWLGILLVCVVGWIACGNAIPVMEDQYVSTIQGRAVSFVLRATDEDIDPLDSTAHELEFVILEGPFHGALIADLDDVEYEPEYAAYVEVAYMPADGFYGTDYIVVTAVDPFGEAASGTTTIQIDVASREGVGLLSGSWDTDFTFGLQTSPVTATRTRLQEVYRVGGLTVTGTAMWVMETPGGLRTITFDVLQFEANLALGLFTLASTVEFEPDRPKVFDYWLNTVRFSLEGLSLVHTLYLTTPQTQSYQSLFFSGSAGAFTLSNTTRFELDADCGYLFSQNDTAVSVTWCDLRARAGLSMTSSGFEKATLWVYGLPVPSWAWLPLGVTLDFGLTYELEEKSLAATIDWKPAWIDCLKVYGELTIGGTNDTAIQGLSIYGVVLECTLPGSIRVRSATALHAAKNGTMTGQIDYFEMVTISGPLMSCCGLPGTFSTSTYFQRASTQLFDWGMTNFRFGLSLTEGFSIETEAVIRSGELGDPTWEFSFGWTVRW